MGKEYHIQSYSGYYGWRRYNMETFHTAEAAKDSVRLLQRHFHSLMKRKKFRIVEIQFTEKVVKTFPEYE